MRILLSILSILVIQACQLNITDNEQIIWVNSVKVECSGVGKMTCLQIQKSDTLDETGNWELYYSSIEGFKYEPGYIYKIKVKTENIENPPVDGSSIKYTLIETIKKTKVERYKFHDIYVLTHINGKNIEKDPVDQTPTLEINISKMEILGSNGCNNFRGAITKIKNETIEFGPIMETMKICQHMMVPNYYSQELTNTKSFKNEINNLLFYNKDNKNTLQFKKVD